MLNIQRFHNLDFLRAFAMTMGLVIHAPLLFWAPDFAKVFGINNIVPVEEWVNIMGRFISSWRMPLFFLLSGFFAILVLERKGILEFLRDRFIRVGLTCLVFSSLYDISDGSFDFTTLHLWFLYELMILVLLFSLFYKFNTIKDFLCTKVPPKIFFIIILWLILTVPLAYILNHWWHPLSLKASTSYFDLKIGNLLYYFSYFLVGVILYSNQNIFMKLKNTKTIVILVNLSLFAFFLRLYSDHLTIGQVDNLRNVAQMEFDPILVFFNACMIGMNSILFCFLFIGLASKFVQSDSSIIRWFVELSYPIYIIHIIPVTMMSAVFYHVGLSQFSMLSLAVITGFFICVILYYVFIKFTPLNWLINGYSKSPLKIKSLGF
ncbi:MAG: hypothetical protein CMP83_10910 [Gammaproteobacteria bacterium]|nr:hypothetical protein [Gammaproteobacteria bacterium]